MGSVKTALSLAGVILVGGVLYWLYDSTMDAGGLSQVLTDFFTGLWEGLPSNKTENEPLNPEPKDSDVNGDGNLNWWEDFLNHLWNGVGIGTTF